ncbi:MAG: type II toxin-antitoxin system RelB/DinJ family antitoxin [Eggerthellaceae bacterium]|nr:type II toxin-antitoxin system RelB/DinJ family antitoxin [Eggerthellaceae bacterium]
MANVNVTIRMDDELKKAADALFEELGMSFTTAINVFVRQSIREGRIPFEITSNPPLGNQQQSAAPKK